MKAIVSIAPLLLVACAHQSATTASGIGTSVSSSHDSNVTRDVQGWHNAQNPTCLFSHAVKATVIERDGDGVTELWTIEGCSGRLFDYETYIMSMGGGITVMVSNVDDSTIGDAANTPTPTKEECAKTKERFDLLNAKEPLTNDELGEIPQLAADLAACRGAP